MPVAGPVESGVWWAVGQMIEVLFPEIRSSDPHPRALCFPGFARRKGVSHCWARNEERREAHESLAQRDILLVAQRQRLRGLRSRTVSTQSPPVSAKQMDQFSKVAAGELHHEEIRDQTAPRARSNERSSPAQRPAGEDKQQIDDQERANASSPTSVLTDTTNLPLSASSFGASRRGHQETSSPASPSLPPFAALAPSPSPYTANAALLSLGRRDSRPNTAGSEDTFASALADVPGSQRSSGGSRNSLLGSPERRDSEELLSEDEQGSSTIAGAQYPSLPLRYQLQPEQFSQPRLIRKHQSPAPISIPLASTSAVADADEPHSPGSLSHSLRSTGSTSTESRARGRSTSATTTATAIATMATPASSRTHGHGRHGSESTDTSTMSSPHAPPSLLGGSARSRGENTLASSSSGNGALEGSNLLGLLPTGIVGGGAEGNAYSGMGSPRSAVLNLRQHQHMPGQAPMEEGTMLTINPSRHSIRRQNSDGSSLASSAQRYGTPTSGESSPMSMHFNTTGSNNTAMPVSMPTGRPATASSVERAGIRHRSNSRSSSRSVPRSSIMASHHGTSGGERGSFIPSHQGASGERSASTSSIFGDAHSPSSVFDFPRDQATALRPADTSRRRTYTRSPASAGSSSSQGHERGGSAAGLGLALNTSTSHPELKALVHRKAVEAMQSGRMTADQVKEILGEAEARDVFATVQYQQAQMSWSPTTRSSNLPSSNSSARSVPAYSRDVGVSSSALPSDADATPRMPYSESAAADYSPHRSSSSLVGRISPAVPPKDMAIDPSAAGTFARVQRRKAHGSGHNSTSSNGGAKDVPPLPSTGSMSSTTSTTTMQGMAAALQLQQILTASASTNSDLAAPPADMRTTASSSPHSARMAASGSSMSALGARSPSKSTSHLPSRPSRSADRRGSDGLGDKSALSIPPSSPLMDRRGSANAMTTVSLAQELEGSSSPRLGEKELGSGGGLFKSKGKKSGGFFKSFGRSGRAKSTEGLRTVPPPTSAEAAFPVPAIPKRYVPEHKDLPQGRQAPSSPSLSPGRRAHPQANESGGNGQELRTALRAWETEMDRTLKGAAQDLERKTDVSLRPEQQWSPSPQLPELPSIQRLPSSRRGSFMDDGRGDGSPMKAARSDPAIDSGSQSSRSTNLYPPKARSASSNSSGTRGSATADRMPPSPRLQFQRPASAGPEASDRNGAPRKVSAGSASVGVVRETRRPSLPAVEVAARGLPSSPTSSESMVMPEQSIRVIRHHTSTPSDTSQSISIGRTVDSLSAHGDVANTVRSPSPAISDRSRSESAHSLLALSLQVLTSSHSPLLDEPQPSEAMLDKAHELAARAWAEDEEFMPRAKIAEWLGSV